MATVDRDARGAHGAKQEGSEVFLTPFTRHLPASAVGARSFRLITPAGNEQGQSA